MKNGIIRNNICELIFDIVLKLYKDDEVERLFNKNNINFNISEYIQNKYNCELSKINNADIYRLTNSNSIIVITMHDIDKIMHDELIYNFSNDEKFVKYDIIFIPVNYIIRSEVTISEYISYMEIICKTIINIINSIYNINIYKSYKYLMLSIITLILKDILLINYDYDMFYENIISKSYFYRNMNDNKLKIVKFLITSSYSNINIISNGTIFKLLRDDFDE